MMNVMIMRVLAAECRYQLRRTGPLLLLVPGMILYGRLTGQTLWPYIPFLFSLGVVTQILIDTAGERRRRMLSCLPLSARNAGCIRILLTILPVATVHMVYAAAAEVVTGTVIPESMHMSDFILFIVVPLLAAALYFMYEDTVLTVSGSRTKHGTVMITMLVTLSIVVLVLPIIWINIISAHRETAVLLAAAMVLLVCGLFVLSCITYGRRRSLL